jgi:prepilin-type N-terminal cleavage/methylation domain-containing protein
MRNDSGFSMIELIIVISIVAILSAIAVPNFVSWIPKYRVKDAAQDLYSNIQMAKMEAIKRNQNCTVTFTNNAGADDRYVVGLINRNVSLADYGSGVQFSATPAPAAITFNSRGIANSALNVSLTNNVNSATYQISILTSGVVSIN